MGQKQSKNRELQRLRQQVDQLLDQNAEVSILKAQVVDLIRQLSASRSTEEVNGLKDEVAMLKEKLGSVPQLPDTNEVDALQAEITKLRKQLASSTKMATLSKGGKRTVSQVPVVGNHVIAFHFPTNAYYTATVVAFDSSTTQFTVAWDDGGTDGTIMDFDKVALDEMDARPTIDEIGMGTKVLFPQGQYKGTPGKNERGIRWHEGVIEKIEDGRFSGRHTQGPKRFRAYVEEFENYTLEQLRLPPNLLQLIQDDSPPVEQHEPERSWDVFLSYSRFDSRMAVEMGQVDKPPSYQDVVSDSMDPRVIKTALESMGYSVWYDEDMPTEYTDISYGIRNSKVFVACLSNNYVANDDRRMEMQFALKNLEKPVVGLVVEQFERFPWSWLKSWAGLLMAGELFIDFTDPKTHQQQLAELEAAVRRSTTLQTQNNGTYAASTSDVFISYSWRDSVLAFESDQVTKCFGSAFNDPRDLANKLGDAGLSVWLDIWSLSAGNSSGMFQQICEGIQGCKLAVVFVSDQYGASENCRMECQYIMKSLAKPVLIVKCGGQGTQWVLSLVGLLVGEQETIDLSFPTGMTELEDLTQHVMQVVQRIKDSKDDETFGTIARKKAKRRNDSNVSSSPVAGEAWIPQIGDAILAFHQTHAFYEAVIASSLDRNTLTYTVDWNDGDPTGKTVHYSDIALDKPVGVGDIGVGSLVVFPQGKYVGTVGKNAGGDFYFKGIVTGMQMTAEGTLVSGHHAEVPANPRRKYSYTWRLLLDQLRLAPNVMDVVANLDTGC
eukprot:m.63352 g.63352  ORF g.63352 m.63352 type:complete len:777 (-) comp23271_c0_seq1:260-2590(-)